MLLPHGTDDFGLLAVKATVTFRMSGTAVMENNGVAQQLQVNTVHGHDMNCWYSKTNSGYFLGVTLDTSMVGSGTPNKVDERIDTTANKFAHLC